MAVINTPGSSISNGLRDRANPDALNGARSLYSLPVTDGAEMFSYGYYNEGLNSIPVHPVEASASHIGINADGTSNLT